MKRQHYEFLHLNPDTRSSFKEKKTLNQLVVNRHMSHTFVVTLGGRKLTISIMNSLVLHPRLMWTLPHPSLVFRRKDLCEAKHDVGVGKLCFS